MAVVRSRVTIVMKMARRAGAVVAGKVVVRRKVRRPLDVVARSRRTKLRSSRPSSILPPKARKRKRRKKRSRIRQVMAREAAGLACRKSFMGSSKSFRLVRSKVAFTRKTRKRLMKTFQIVSSSMMSC